MQTTKKKPSLIFILVGAVLSGYLGYLINGAWTEGIAFNDFMNRFNEVCAVPFANYYHEFPTSYSLPWTVRQEFRCYMVTNSRQYSAFSCVRQPFSESFFETFRKSILLFGSPF